MGGSATTSNTAGSNDNKDNYGQRQNNLQKNINKLKAKGATAESIAGLEAKKAKEAKQFKQNTQGIKDGKAYVNDKLGLKTNQTNGSSTQKKSYGAYNLKGKDIGFYGEEASQATNDYLRSIGEMGVKGKDGIFRGNNITAQGLKMKFGKSNTAMGSGDPTGIMTSTQISQPMFQSQKNIQGLVLGAMALGGIPLSGSMLIYNSRPGNNYNNYLNKFYSTMSSSGIQSSQKNNQQGTDVVSNNSQVVDQTTKETDIVTTSKFKKKKANNASDNIASARSLFKKTGQTITGSMV
tara:strand:+ start:3313 stop:4191 length:879 start_codon:yes stop_codon:yes gene_type:complete